MNMRTAWIRQALSLALIVGLVAPPEALAGKPGHKGGGGARKPPRMSAAHRANKPPAPHKAPQPTHARNNNLARAGNANAQPHMSTTRPHANATARVASASAVSPAAYSPSTYLYGSGKNARRYQAHGYGRGYRNSYSANRSGYGQSQGNARAIAARLRSVHRSLARLDHDYNGHRVRAMRHLSMAVRQLTHRSTTNGPRAALAANTRPAVANGNANARRGPRLSQAQSDQRLGQAMRTTQGVALQMSHQGASSGRMAQAGTHVRRAVRELHTALTVR